MPRQTITAKDLAEMPQAEFDKLDDDLVKQIVALEKTKAARLERRLAGLKSGDLQVDSANSVGGALGISRQAVLNYEERAKAKIRRFYPELRTLLQELTH